LIELKKNDEPPKNYKVGTGMEFFYNAWDKLDWKPIKGQAQGTFDRRKFLSLLKKDEIFIDKWLVIPPYYRDIDMQGGKKNEINKLYTRLVTNAAAIKQSSAIFSIFGTTPAHKKIQDTINELYSYFIDLVGGSKGYIHRYVMGKATDFSARCVISGARYDAKSQDDVEVTYSHSATPLSTCIKAFSPFIVYGVRKFIEKIIAGSEFMWNLTDKGTVERQELAPNWKDTIGSENINRLIDLYYESQEHRLDDFTLPLKNGGTTKLWVIPNEGWDPEESQLPKDQAMIENKWKPVNLTELFYMAAYDTVRDKTIYITRYPIEDQHNIYPSLMNIIPCESYGPRMIENTLYPRFPKAFIGFASLRVFFIDTLRVFPSYLKALGGDFDGDMVSIQGVFTNEANTDATKYIYSKMNIMDVSGGTMREFSEIASMTAFMITYKHDIPV
jgi:hypothetical protein